MKNVTYNQRATMPYITQINPQQLNNTVNYNINQVKVLGANSYTVYTNPQTIQNIQIPNKTFKKKRSKSFGDVDKKTNANNNPNLQYINNNMQQVTYTKDLRNSNTPNKININQPSNMGVFAYNNNIQATNIIQQGKQVVVPSNLPNTAIPIQNPNIHHPPQSNNMYNTNIQYQNQPNMQMKQNIAPQTKNYTQMNLTVIDNPNIMQQGGLNQTIINPQMNPNNTNPNPSINKSFHKKGSLRASRNKSPPQVSNNGKMQQVEKDRSGNEYLIEDENEISDKKISNMIQDNLKKEIEDQKSAPPKPNNTKRGAGYRCYSLLSHPGKNQNGQLKTNQDTPLAEINIGNIPGFNMFGVLDGHGPEGHFVSQFCRDYFKRRMNEYAEMCTKKGLTTPDLIYNELKQTEFIFIKEAYKNADEEMKKQTKFDYNFSGTTCNIAFQLNKHLICANVGDSRGILVFDNGTPNYDISPISFDHKPDLPKEKERIYNHGGMVDQITNSYGMKVGPMRVWKNGLNYPGLAMSRSLGDFQAKECGVIAEPDITEHTIEKSSTKYLVICSDGVWEFIKNESVKELGNVHYAKNDVGGFCSGLVRFAMTTWEKFDIIRDDITVVCVYF